MAAKMISTKVTGIKFNLPIQYHLEDVQDHGIKDGREKDNDYVNSLGNLPTELLVKILSYLSTRDRIAIRYVSRKFQDVGEVPLLWKEVWSDYDPRHMIGVINVLKACGEHVRTLSFPGHVKPIWILEMASCCTKVTHLSLPKNTQVSLYDLEKIVCTMPQLQELDVFTEGKLIIVSLPLPFRNRTHGGDVNFITGLLEVTIATSMRKLKLRVNCYLMDVVASLKEWIGQGNPLPPSVSIFTSAMTFVWPPESSYIYELPSFEIGLYSNRKIPLNLYPIVPFRKFKFGPSATPPLIRLNDHGIEGLEHDVFYLNDYNHCGTVRYTAISFKPRLLEKHLSNYISITHLCLVSYFDFCNKNIDVCSNHLEQLAVVCPNLQQLNLRGNVNCLKHLQGLRAIVNTCQNLEGINLTKISVSRVESQALLWELLSNLKKLTHLAIDLCLMKANDANRQKLIGMFISCQSLKALEIHCDYGCAECKTGDFLFSYFPSLTYCRICDFQYPSLAYAITNCHKLKYLYVKNLCQESVFPLSNNCLQQLHIYSASLRLTDEFIEVLSSHGQLECVILYVKYITINGLTTLVSNSPNLTLLCVSVTDRTFRYEINYATHRIKNTFSYRKLLTVGSFKVCAVNATYMPTETDSISWLDTDLNSLWPSFESVVDPDTSYY